MNGQHPEHQGAGYKSVSSNNASQTTRQTIVQLLSNMTDGKEIRSYLQRFSAVDQARFAVIKIGGAILRDSLDETAAALAFLHTVGLTPIVIHGAGPQLDDALDARGIETEKRDGLRVTRADAFDVARDIFVRENIRLVEAVRAQGVEAHSLTSGAISAHYLDQEKYGFVGDPTAVHLDLINSVVRSGAIPILTCLGVSPGGQLLNVNADAATRALVNAVKPIKIVFLTGVGGLLNGDGQVMHSINLATDFDGLMNADWVNGGMRVKLQEIQRLLEAAPMSSSVSISTPAALVKELFTHSGAGTLVRRGEVVRVEQQKSALDEQRLRALVEKAFQRPLKPDWWAKLDLHEGVVSQSYRAGALLTKVDGFTYLDKFAVLEDARGEGLARTIWRDFIKRNPAFYWRSRTTNGFNAFYHDVASGSVKRGEWTVFWRGEDSFATIEKIVAKVAALPDAFEGKAEQGTGKETRL
ncbi:MAG: acetylglutamate kinase [Pseudomonadota bacterium]